MDYVRSCYTTVMRVCADPATDYPVAWYFAPPGAQLYPGEHSFGSGNWDFNHLVGPYQLGEQAGPLGNYSKGANIWGYLGKCQVGTPDQFVNGLSAADLELPPQPLPACCGPQWPALTGSGGVELAGIAGFGAVESRILLPCSGNWLPQTLSGGRVPGSGITTYPIVFSWNAGLNAFIAPITVAGVGAGTLVLRCTGALGAWTIMAPGMPALFSIPLQANTSYNESPFTLTWVPLNGVRLGLPWVSSLTITY